MKERWRIVISERLGKTDSGRPKWSKVLELKLPNMSLSTRQRTYLKRMVIVVVVSVLAETQLMEGRWSSEIWSWFGK